MRISEAKECITELYKNTDSVVALVSERGVGKTSAFQQCADEMGIRYMGLYAAAMEGPDFMGLPDKDREKGITRYLAPQLQYALASVHHAEFMNSKSRAFSPKTKELLLYHSRQCCSCTLKKRLVFEIENYTIYCIYT